MDRKIRVSKIFNLFGAVFLGNYLPYLIIFTVVFFTGSVPLLGSSLENFVIEVILISTVSIIFSVLVLIFIYLLSLIDERILIWSFAFIFSMYCFSVIFISYFFVSKNLFFSDIFWLIFMLIFVPPIGIFIVKKLKK